MNSARVLPAFTAFACLILAAPFCTAQDPAQGGPPPPRIQGPSGGPLAAPPASDANGSTQEQLKFKMYALLGQKKSAATTTLDEAMKPIEGALKGLPYTNYEKITVEERETSEGTDMQFPINAVYSLVVRPNGDDGQGAAKLDIHVDLMQDGKLIKALTAQAAAKPGDALLLRGMPLPPGELVIVLQRDAGDQKSQGGQSDKDQQEQDQQQQQQQSDQDKESKKDDSEKKLDESKKDKKKEDEKKDKKEVKAEKKEDKDQDKQEQAQEQPSSEDEKKDSAEKKDAKNLESILKSLEDVDRKEQSEVRNKRDRIDFKGDWW